jgi:hypothetical protein
MLLNHPRVMRAGREFAKTMRERLLQPLEIEMIAAPLVRAIQEWAIFGHAFAPGAPPPPHIGRCEAFSVGWGLPHHLRPPWWGSPTLHRLQFLQNPLALTLLRLLLAR